MKHGVLDPGRLDGFKVGFRCVTAIRCGLAWRPAENFPLVLDHHHRHRAIPGIALDNDSVQHPGRCPGRQLKELGLPWRLDDDIRMVLEDRDDLLSFRNALSRKNPPVGLVLNPHPDLRTFPFGSVQGRHPRLPPHGWRIQGCRQGDQQKPWTPCYEPRRATA